MKVFAVILLALLAWACGMSAAMAYGLRNWARDEEAARAEARWALVFLLLAIICGAGVVVKK